MDGHRKRERTAGRYVDRRPGDFEPADIAGVSRNGSFNNGGQFRPGPLLSRQQVMRISQCYQPSVKRGARFSHCRAATKRLARYRLHCRKRVLYSVIEFVGNKRKPPLIGDQRIDQSVSLGYIPANDQDTTYPVWLTFVVDRAKAICPPNVLTFSVTGHRYEVILMPRRAFAGHDLLDLRTNDAPNFLPAFATALSECAWVPFRSQSLTISVVVKLDQFRTPPDEHRVLGVKEQPHCRLQALRP